MLPSGCAGFPLGYPSRADRDINTKYTYLVQDRRPDAPVCQPDRQNIPGNNPFPPASVTPGQNLHLTWQPDGHLDDANPSTVYMYWTGVPGTQLYTRSELSPEKLLGTMTFATSANCDQAWEPNTWCHGHVVVPEGTQPGTYQLIWWWKYDRNPAGEEYSTCFEIVVGGSEIQPRDIPVQAFAKAKETSTPSSGDASKKPKLTYMTEDSTWASDSPSIEEAVSKKSTTLKDLASEPDQPLTAVPNYAIGEDISENRNDNVDDKTDSPAEDTVNNAEEDDAPAFPKMTPSQLINNTLSEQKKAKVNGSKNTKGVVATQNGTSSADTALSDSTTNSTVLNSFRPETSNSTSTERDSTHNQTLVGHMPTLGNDASDITAHSLFPVSGTALLSIALAMLTWMMV
ncbi:hypothetical protein BGZ58_004328 [Dissophora ornata]|nr:hypothetical protein BGZ58_004328 [Dissophora ornata]